VTYLYIAGPMRGKELFNFPAFDQAEKELTSAGFKCFSPARRDREAGFYPESLSEWTVEAMEASGYTLREALYHDTAWITQQADGIALLPGWKDSKGAQAEVALARALGLPVKIVPDWIQHSGQRAPKTYDVNVIPFDKNGAGPIFDSCDNDDKSERDFFLPHQAQDRDQGVPIYQAGVTYYKDLEVRLTSKTGGEKGSKLARFDLLPVGPLTELAEHFGRGAQKYEDRNWERGYDWSLSYAALMRHLTQFWAGEDIDPETGGKHIIAVAWHALALAQFMDRNREFDNRPVTTREAA
jgi:hypothetical protein